jgi:hypothetical protein
MIPGAEMRARLDDRIGVAAVTYLLFGVTLGPGLALSLVLVFAIWIGWRWLCRKCPRGELSVPVQLWDELMTRSTSRASSPRWRRSTLRDPRCASPRDRCQVGA